VDVAVAVPVGAVEERQVRLRPVEVAEAGAEE
jgi:hypothetical protein